MDNKKHPDLSVKERATLDVIRDQINLCRSEIAEYNSQFLASTVLCAFVASFATIVQVAKVDTLLNVFYILPSIYFLSLYNVIKYTAEQLKLGAYRLILEREARKYIIGEFLCWEELIPKGFSYMFWGGVVQIFLMYPFHYLFFWDSGNYLIIHFGT